MTKIALCILYNHRFDKNISCIEKLYEGRFSHIFHIMPFYDGNKSNVIPVYESSYYFQSYIAQAWQHIKSLGFTHFFVVPDDMVLNPMLDEHNLFDLTGISKEQCFINDIREVYDCYQLRHEIKKYKIEQKGVEVKNILPSKEDAILLFKKNGLEILPLSKRQMLRIIWYMFNEKRLKATIGAIKDVLLGNNEIEYPLIWGYSDVLLLTGEVMPKFVTYCGAFAATRLFVEYAIPTALVFSTTNIVTDTSIKLHGVTQLYSSKKKNKSEKVWATDKYRPLVLDAELFIEQYQYSLSNLLENYPKDIFFIHPIKLSQWK